MSSQPKHLSDALRGRPELAREIGYLMADYAAIEFLLFQIFAMLTPLRPSEAFSLWFSRRSINKKTELLEKEMWRLDETLQAALKRICRRAKGAAARRTEVAHAHVMEGTTGPMRLHLFGESAKLAPLDQDFINRTIDQFHTLAIDVVRLASYIGALAPDIVLARLEEVFAPIDAQLQRSRAPRDRPRPFEKAVKAASDKRLGLDPDQRYALRLSVRKDAPLAGSPKS